MFKKGDKVKAKNKTIYSVTDKGWEGIVTKDENTEGSMEVSKTDNPKDIDYHTYEVESEYFDLIKAKKSMGNLAAATMALKKSGPSKDWEVEIKMTVTVNAWDKETAEQAAKEQWIDGRFRIVSSGGVEIIQTKEIG